MQSDLAALPDLREQLNRLRLDYLKSCGKSRRGELPSSVLEIKSQLSAMEKHVFILGGKQSADTRR